MTPGDSIRFGWVLGWKIPVSIQNNLFVFDTGFPMTLAIVHKTCKNVLIEDTDPFDNSLGRQPLAPGFALIVVERCLSRGHYDALESILCGNIFDIKMCTIPDNTKTLYLWYFRNSKNFNFDLHKPMTLQPNHCDHLLCTNLLHSRWSQWFGWECVCCGRAVEAVVSIK